MPPASRALAAYLRAIRWRPFDAAPIDRLMAGFLPYTTAESMTTLEFSRPVAGRDVPGQGLDLDGRLRLRTECDALAQPI